jgi:hypothetical protein
MPTDLAPRQKGEPQPPIIGGSGYVLSRQVLLDAFQNKGRSPDLSKLRMGHKKLLGNVNRLEHLTSVAVWREDMATFIPELMRRRIVEDLLYLDGQSRPDTPYLVRCETWAELGNIKRFPHWGVGLYIGGEDAQGEISRPVSRMSTLELPERTRPPHKLVVFDLDALLGEKHVAKLRGSSTVFKDGTLFMLGRKRTVEVQLKLWKLHGYLLKDGGKEKKEELKPEDKMIPGMEDLA